MLETILLIPGIINLNNYPMDDRQSLLNWLGLYIHDPQIQDNIFQAHFANIPSHAEASWRMDKIWDMLYNDREYEYSIIHWIGYLEILYQSKLLFFAIRIKFCYILCPFFPFKIEAILILYMEIDLYPICRVLRHYEC